MNDNFHMMTKAETDGVMSMYFNVIRGGYMRDALKYFAEKQGYGQEVIFVSFQDDLDDEDQSRLPQRLDNDHVLLEFDYPAADVNEYAYLDFKSFYRLLDKHAKKFVEEYPEDSELLNLLVKVKAGLGVQFFKNGCCTISIFKRTRGINQNAQIIINLK